MTRISLLFVSAFLLLSSASMAQMKIAHINTNQLIASMPEADSAQAKLQAMNNELVKTGEELQVEYNKAYVAYEKDLATMSPLIRKTKEDALQDMMSRIQEFGNNSQQALTQKQEELYQPILVKAQNAIQEIADEKGFDYILDTGQGTVLTIPKDESLNILSLVQAKLGIEVK